MRLQTCWGYRGIYNNSLINFSVRPVSGTLECAGEHDATPWGTWLLLGFSGKLPGLLLTETGNFPSSKMG